jgi:hypothetical protein
MSDRLQLASGILNALLSNDTLVRHIIKRDGGIDKMRQRAIESSFKWADDLISENKLTTKE